MKRSVYLLSAMLFLSISCSDSGAANPDAGTDAGTDAGPGDCDPVANTGCEAGEKCSSLLISSDPSLTTSTTCLPDGTVRLGGACTVGAAGETTGFDDCRGGSYCSSGVCVEICSTSPDSCPTDEACSLFADLFADRTDIGLCGFVCD
ncbi:MAG: hypothetical protein WCF10_13555, partial [Polyangiales bacterium]